MSQYNLIMLILVFPFICFFCGICGGVIYLIYSPIRDKLIEAKKLTLKQSEQINTLFTLLVSLFTINQTYDAFFPGESFYEDEFEYVTMRDIPLSTNFISKAASYPDFHGDYCSASMIVISPSDYKKLLNELKNDSRLSNCNMSESQELNEVMGKRNTDEIIYSFQRIIKYEEDRHLSIGFLKDGKTIIVQVCVT